MTAGTPGFRFHEGVAPFGQLDVLLPHRVDYSRLPATIGVAMPMIGTDAWLQSSWLQEIVGHDELAKKSREHQLPFRAGLLRDASSAYHLSDHALAVAVQPVPGDERDFNELFPIGLTLSNISGYGTGMIDVSGNAFARAWKRLAMPKKVYAKTGNVNVTPEKQGQKIGSAILFGVLSQLPNDKKATVFVARQNSGLIAKLSLLGYEDTGSRLRDNFVTGYKIEEVRLEAPSVAEVKDKLVKAYSWLSDAERIEF